MGLDSFLFKKTTAEVGYWRKANHIHGWFVRNVQDGVDDCGEYEVTKEDLEKLLAECEFVLENKDKAAEILPTESGFFFGGTDYDERYFRDIEDTIAQVEKILNDWSTSWHETIVYQASW